MPKNEFFKRLLFGVWKNIFYRMYGIFFIKPEKDYVNITIFLKTRCGLRQVDMLSNFCNTYGCKYIRKISWVYQISPQPLPPPPHAPLHWRPDVLKKILLWYTCDSQIRGTIHFKMFYIRSYSSDILELDEPLTVPFENLWATPIIIGHG